MKDKENTVSKRINTKETPKDLSGIKQLKTLEFDNSSGFVCDINSGICGPIDQKKEGKQ